MENIKINIDKAFSFISKSDYENFLSQTNEKISQLENKTGKGNDFLGWVNLPTTITEHEITEIEKTAEYLKSKVDLVVIVGIGGSYLGSKAVIDALSDSFTNLKTKKEYPHVIFAGQNISEDYHYELIELLNDKSYGVIVISKSGTTTEPALSFRILKEHIEHKYGKSEAKNRIIAITDKSKGALRELADKEGYKTFVIPDDVGGRYSVLTPVGLLPIAVAGFSIRQLINGAKKMENLSGSALTSNENICSQYASIRNTLLKSGKTTEILVSYTPKLQNISEWWKQLYGESEGKENKGIFPASVNFTCDLHSMGQYIQEGMRNIFETVISVKSPKYKFQIPKEEIDLDKLNFLAGRRIDDVNKMAELGTMLAHVDGGVPNIKIELPELNEYYLGQLLYFFEKACGISGYILGINPFDQPGVEAYKKNMFALLGKPGFENETRELKAKID
ncbi:MAG: glucose-6-phosphate isomerase [Bacteroidetes bacterium GWA2_31_9]|nr:MAG: glucose-6-phosphate isomerase [Bacteroidetes bacterium GWA2_31_9]